MLGEVFGWLVGWLVGSFYGKSCWVISCQRQLNSYSLQLSMVQKIHLYNYIVSGKYFMLSCNINVFRT